MGHRNVAAVFDDWSHLPHQPFRLLTYMAHVSLDERGESGPARRFFQGRDAMAAALGFPVPEGAGDSDRARCYQRVKAALKVLTMAGVVRQVQTGRNGSNSRYELVLIPTARGTVNVPLQGDGDRTPSPDLGVRPESARGTTSVRKGYDQRPPEEKEGNEGEEGTPAASPPPASAPITELPPPHCPDHPGGTRDPCRACGDARKRRETAEHEQTEQHRALDAELRARYRADVEATGECPHGVDGGTVPRWFLPNPTPSCATCRKRAAA